MASVQVTELITRVRDITDCNDDQFVTDAMILRWLNNARPRLDAMIARAGWVLNMASDGTDSGPSDLVNGAIEINDEVMAVVAVFEYFSDGSTRGPLRSTHPTWVSETTASASSHYFVDGPGITPSGVTTKTRVNLRPVPQAGDYLVYYIPVGDQLVTGTPAADQDDEVNYPNGWEEWLVLEVARQVLAREETVNPAIEQRKLEIEKSVVQMAGDRLFAQGPKVRDVASQGTDQSSLLIEPWTWVWL